MSRERRRGLPCRAMAISLGRKQWEAFDELEDRKNTGGGLGGGRHRLYRRGRRAAEGDQNPDQYLARRAQAGRRGASAIAPGIRRRLQGDRKSTRLNSSH